MKTQTQREMPMGEVREAIIKAQIELLNEILKEFYKTIKITYSFELTTEELFDNKLLSQIIMKKSDLELLLRKM
mgnify:CR=1 FL=1